MWYVNRTGSIQLQVIADRHSNRCVTRHNFNWDIANMSLSWSAGRKLRLAFAPLLAMLILASFACGGGEAVIAEEAATAVPIVTETPVIPDTSPVANTTVSRTSPEDPSTYLLFNQKLVEGLTTEDVDLTDVDAVFWHVFSRLPDEVIIYPSENYYYFIMYTGKRQLWGNIRLAAGRRERGVLSFAFFEYRETPYVSEPRVSLSKFFTRADGLIIEELDPFKFRVTYDQKTVIFNLHKLSQDPPKLFDLGDDETSIMRTFDESGYQFFLIFNEERNYFNWVLNEEAPISDNLVPLSDDLVVGRKSGFAFWIDPDHDDRKVLVAIRGESASRNDYYDGPFDQLADNYVDVTNVAEFMVRAAPSLAGRIDKYGYFTDRHRPSRVSVSPYYVYFSRQALDIYFERLKEAEDPYFFASRKGLPPTPTPTQPGATTQP